MIDYMNLYHHHHSKPLLLTTFNMHTTFLPAILPNVHRFKKFFFWKTQQ